MTTDILDLVCQTPPTGVLSDHPYVAQSTEYWSSVVARNRAEFERMTHRWFPLLDLGAADPVQIAILLRVWWLEATRLGSKERIH